MGALILSRIDRQRRDAVALLLTLGYGWGDDGWTPPAAAEPAPRPIAYPSKGTKLTQAEDVLAEILRAGYWPPGAEYPTHWDLYRLNCAVRHAFIMMRGK